MCYLFPFQLNQLYLEEPGILSCHSHLQVRDTDKTGEAVPFTIDDLAQSVYPDMLMEVKPLDTFSGFTKGFWKP